MQVTTAGLDLVQNVFHLHGIAADKAVAFGRSLRRSQMLSFCARLEPCLIGMEAAWHAPLLGTGVDPAWP